MEEAGKWKQDYAQKQVSAAASSTKSAPVASAAPDSQQQQLADLQSDLDALASITVSLPQKTSAPAATSATASATAQALSELDALLGTAAAASPSNPTQQKLAEMDGAVRGLVGSCTHPFDLDTVECIRRMPQAVTDVCKACTDSMCTYQQFADRAPFIQGLTHLQHAVRCVMFHQQSFGVQSILFRGIKALLKLALEAVQTMSADLSRGKKATDPLNQPCRDMCQKVCLELLALAQSIKSFSDRPRQQYPLPSRSSVSSLPTDAVKEIVGSSKLLMGASISSPSASGVHDFSRSLDGVLTTAYRVKVSAGSTDTSSLDDVHSAGEYALEVMRALLANPTDDLARAVSARATEHLKDSLFFLLSEVKNCTLEQMSNSPTLKCRDVEPLVVPAPTTPCSLPVCSAIDQVSLSESVRKAAQLAKNMVSLGKEDDHIYETTKAAITQMVDNVAAVVSKTRPGSVDSLRSSLGQVVAAGDAWKRDHSHDSKFQLVSATTLLLQNLSACVS